jgi:hypothetical protein
MATPFSLRPEPGDESVHAVAVGVTGGDLLTVTGRGITAQAAATFAILTGLWVAVSPVFVMLQHGGSNANTANLIAGLAVAVLGATALVGRRAFGSLQAGILVLGVWVLISSFILDAKFPIAAPMFWSNSFSGGLLVALALGALATVRSAAR